MGIELDMVGHGIGVMVMATIQKVHIMEKLPNMYLPGYILINLD